MLLLLLLFCPSWSCTIICCINRFTSLCKNLFNLLEFLAEAFRCHVHHFQCLTVSVDLAVMFLFKHSNHNNITAIPTTMNRNISASSTRTVKQWKWCTWHRKAFAKNSSKLNKFLHSEVNQLIQHIIVQDQDGQNNIIYTVLLMLLNQSPCIMKSKQ